LPCRRWNISIPSHHYPTVWAGKIGSDLSERSSDPSILVLAAQLLDDEMLDGVEFVEGHLREDGVLDVVRMG